MDYAGKHAKALLKVKDKGAPVVFAHIIPGTHNPETEEFTLPIHTAIVGYAAEIPGDPEEYALPEFSGKEPITLFFVPTLIGQLPAMGSTINWAGSTRTVTKRFAIRPAGTTIAVRLILT